jgi:hypothetical protein
MLHIGSTWKLYFYNILYTIQFSLHSYWFILFLQQREGISAPGVDSLFVIFFVVLTSFESLTLEREQVCYKRIPRWRKLVLWIFRTCSLFAVSDSFLLKRSWESSAVIVTVNGLDPWSYILANGTFRRPIQSPAPMFWVLRVLGPKLGPDAGYPDKGFLVIFSVCQEKISVIAGLTLRKARTLPFWLVPIIHSQS